MSTSTYQATATLNYLFGGTALTLPLTYYVGLSTTTIAASGMGITEPSSMDGYARVAVPNDKDHFHTATIGILWNLGLIVFPEATGNWGTITDVFLSDSLSGGNMLYYGALQSSVSIPTSTVALFQATTLILSMA